MQNELIDLDFAPGIKSEYINQNFNIIHNWLRRERLRTAGWGLVEGFNLSADIPSGIITVSDGMMINRDGEEVIVPGTRFVVGEMEATSVAQTVVGPASGCIELERRPYSKKQRGYFQFKGNIDKDFPAAEEFFIEDLTSGLQVPVMQIDGKRCYINAEDWKGHDLQITYFTTKDRIDSIMLYKDGTYKYEKSIVSSSPSHVDLGDYDNCYMIGVAYWTVDTKTSVEFFTDHRTYRKVYVDELNRLWLNGKLYKEAQIIHMVEPEDPKPDDMWYDGKTNTLMIWKENNGVYGWVVMNDNATIEERQVKIFYPDSKDYPKDNQHFRFRDDEVNLHFVPGRHSLEIIIDNTPVMSDQYSEFLKDTVTDKKYTALGRGFDLKAPLDRATPVEVIVHHAVKAKPVRETFQRAAIFIAEGYDHYAASNRTKVFETITDYVLGDDQLEVFIDGKRLTKGLDFVEMKNSTQEATANDRHNMSKFFKLKSSIAAGQLVTHKISKHVWSFDQLNQMIKDIEAKADKAISQAAQLRTSVENLSGNVANQIQNLSNQIAKLETKYGNPADYVKKSDMIAYAKIPSEVKAKLVKETINMTVSAKTPIVMTNTKLTDFFIVNYISGTMNRALIKGTEYTPVQNGNDVRIDLKPALMVTGANVYITGMKMGV